MSGKEGLITKGKMGGVKRGGLNGHNESGMGRGKKGREGLVKRLVQKKSLGVDR